MKKIDEIINPDRFKRPNEMDCIKSYVSDKLGFVPQIEVKPNQIRINVPDSATAGSLRPELHKIGQHCKTKRKIFIQIKQG